MATTYFSANFNSMTNGDNLDTYTPETGAIFQHSVASPSNDLLATGGRVRTTGDSDPIAIYYADTTDPQLNIDVEFDVRIVSDDGFSSSAGVISRWGNTAGIGFACYLQKDSGSDATIHLVRWNHTLGNTSMGSAVVSVSVGNTYHIKHSLRSSGGNTSHSIYWNGSGTPEFTVAASSTGPQVVGKVCVLAGASNSGSGNHLDNVTFTTFDTPVVNTSSAFFMMF
jgi:hypothetical protein